MQVVMMTTPAATKVATMLTGTIAKSQRSRLTTEGAGPEAMTETMAMAEATPVGGTTCPKGQTGCVAQLYLTTRPTVPSSHAKKPKY